MEMCKKSVLMLVCEYHYISILNKISQAFLEILSGRAELVRQDHHFGRGVVGTCNRKFLQINVKQ